MKKLSMSLLTIGILGTTILGVGGATVSAISHLSKPEKLAELTDKSVDEIIAEKHATDKTYGEVANEYGVLDEFQNYNHENKQEAIQELVNNGSITEEESEVILQHITDQQANCDGTGYQNHANTNNHQNYNSEQSHNHNNSNHNQNHKYNQDYSQHSQTHRHHNHE